MPQVLKSVIVELGLAEYLDAFVEHGFDSWDAILDIQESELNAIGVKLGHRRKLQRRIAHARGIASSIPLLSVWKPCADDHQQHNAVQREPFSHFEVGFGSTDRVKRKYRHHPKRDGSAPKRPPSAYVLFSSKMREDFKGDSLSFIEIAKLVGENWRSLDEGEREFYESQANDAKDKYRESLAEYKKCPDYRRYAHYLQNFKEKQRSRHQGGQVRPANASLNKHKIRGRPAALGLHHDSSNGSSSSGDATPNDTISIFTTGGGSSGSKRLRESEPLHDCERQVASISIAALQLSSPTAVPHGISLDDDSFLPQNNHLENGSRPTEGRHCERPSWYTTRTRHLEPNNQYLPPLSDILDDNGQSARSRLPLAPGSFAIAKSSHSLHPANKVTERTGGYKSPKVYLGGSSILSTHVWVSSDKSDILYAKVPMRGVSGANGEDAAVESSHRLPSHSNLLNLATSRHVKMQQTVDRGAAMSKTKHSATSTTYNDAGRFDGMSALLQAGELLAAVVVAKK